ncbi:MAG: beta-ketoacyl-ACP synthase II [Nitrospinota bacterium]
MRNGRRVVFTGMGLVTPLGNDVETTWSALVEGKSGIGPITQFDTTDYNCRVAGEVQNFDSEKFLEKKEIKRVDRFIHFALAATQEAMEDAGLEISDSNSQDVGVLVGAGLGGLPMLEKVHAVVLDRGPGRISPFFIPGLIANMASGMLSMRYNARGPNACVCTACATGTHCIGDAARLIERGDAVAMIAGSTESVICPLSVGGFSAMRALSTHNEPSEKASRPFDLSRTGFVIGEGAGVLILEELEHAKKRGARIHGEIIGYGMTGDAYHMTQPDPNGDGPSRCMQVSLKDAAIAPEDVGYINAHGTGTPQGDINETNAIKNVFGDHAYKIPVSSTKSMTGHLLGGAGGVETIFTLLSLDRGVIPPTINLEEPDPQCDLDYVPNEARETNESIGLTNSFGFGGTNATIIVRRGLDGH